MPKISILIPAYNVEKYVARCLDSVISQSFDDIEVIVVDDGSTDGTSDIVSRYVADDKRVRLVRHHGNYGVLWGRKTCVENADGDFIMFVDADDTIEPDTCKILYNTAVSQGADIVVCGNYYNKADGSVLSYTYKLSYGGDSESVIKSMVFQEMSHVLWGRIYSKSLWKGRDYFYERNYNYADDLSLSFQVSRNVRKAVVIDDILYHYYQYSSSLMGRRLDARGIDNKICSQARMLEIASSVDSETRRKAELNVVRASYNLIKDGYPRKVVMGSVKENNLSPLFSLASLRILLGLWKAVSYFAVFHLGPASSFVSTRPH